MAKRPLTVLQVLPALEGGGVERGTLEVAAELVRTGNRSIVMSAGGRMVAELEAGGSEHIAWSIGAKSPLTLRHVPRLRRLLRERAVDILHARSRLPAWIAYLAWRGMDPAARPRFVTTVHGLYSVSRYSAVMTKGERIVAVSGTVRDYILDNYPGANAGRIQVIYRGVDPDEFPYGFRPSQSWLDEWYRRYPQVKDAFVLTLPGRLTRLKGHEDFIRLIGALRTRGARVHGLIVGGEDPRRKGYAAEIATRIRTEGLTEFITNVGHRSDMREIYAASDAVLSLSSHQESFGRTVLEALSLGVPVIGYDHGGVGEILHRLFPEGCVAPGDVASCVQKVEDFMRSPPTVPPTGEFSLHDMLDATMALYRSLTDEPR